MTNVQFKLGEIIEIALQDWKVVGVTYENNLPVCYTVSNDAIGIELMFRSESGVGRNYSLPMGLKSNGRRYHAMRYLHKYVSLVQDLSNELFKRYQAANETKETPQPTKEPLYTLSDCESSIGEMDIRDTWVVIKPNIMYDLFFEEGRTRRNQIVFATGGFGCSAGALSTNGGKVYCNYYDDHNQTIEDWVYRNELLGIASEQMIEELDLPQKCPDCSRMKKLDALSRDNKRMICSECGTMEALREMGIR